MLSLTECVWNLIITHCGILNNMPYYCTKSFAAIGLIDANCWRVGGVNGANLYSMPLGLMLKSLSVISPKIGLDKKAYNAASRCA